MSGSNRRTVLKGIGAGTAALLGGVGVVGASGPPSEGDTIVDVAVAADGFDVLVAAVKEAGLVDALSGNRQLTVFAPTDKAFNVLGVSVDTEDNLVVEDPAASLLSKSSLTLADILLYHVAPGRRDAESVTTSDEIPTLNGALIEVDGTRLNPTGPDEEQAEIITQQGLFNIQASNGIIHAIDGVLLP